MLGLSIKRQLLFVVLLNLLCACSFLGNTKKTGPKLEKPWLKRGLLTSERIEKKFGSFYVQVMFQDKLSGIRISNLYSAHDPENVKVTRALALVRFELTIDKRLFNAHKEILDGASIGTTLTKHGFTLRKDIVYKNKVSQLPEKINQMMKTDAHEFAAIEYELTASIDGLLFPYCTITEVYSPDFLTFKELGQLYESDDKSSHDAVFEKFGRNASPEKINDSFDLLRAAIASL